MRNAAISSYFFGIITLQEPFAVNDIACTNVNDEFVLLISRGRPQFNIDHSEHSHIRYRPYQAASYPLPPRLWTSSSNVFVIHSIRREWYLGCTQKQLRKWKVILLEKVIADTSEARAINAHDGTHRLSNLGDDLLEVVEVHTGEYLEEDDIFRYEDVYARFKVEIGAGRKKTFPNSLRTSR